MNIEQMSDHHCAPIQRLVGIVISVTESQSMDQPRSHFYSSLLHFAEEAIIWPSWVLKASHLLEGGWVNFEFDS